MLDKFPDIQKKSIENGEILKMLQWFSKQTLFYCIFEFSVCVVQQSVILVFICIFICYYIYLFACTLFIAIMYIF